ncbi:MAG: rod shape-determining protein RodA [Ignavibacteria bacterium]|nr:rod shape-determining protein RodA [Ignavibacteria bacterium]
MKEKVGKSKTLFQVFDTKLLASVFFLILVGIYSIYSNNLNSETLIPFQKHLGIVFWGIVIIFVTAFIPETWLRSLSFPIYLVSLLLLIAVLIFGVEIHGTKGWLRLGGYSFQPVEFAKLAVILTSSAFLSIPGVSLKNIRGFGSLFVIFLIPLIFIILQPDFGSAIILLIILWGILYWSDFNLNILLALVGFPFILLFYLKGMTEFIVTVIIFTGIVLFINKQKYVTSILTVALVVVLAIGTKDIINHLPKHQQERIKVFVDPSYAPLKESYNMIQSLLAIGSGGLLGKGPFAGTQTQLKYVFAQNTDFVFSIPAEEFGFVGSVAIIIAFYVLLSRVLKIGIETNSLFLKYSILGYAMLLFSHFVENIGMAIGLLPVMGIPLPFVSSGGSFFVVNSFLVGITLNACRRKFRDV